MPNLSVRQREDKLTLPTDEFRAKPMDKDEPRTYRVQHKIERVCKYMGGVLFV